MDYKTTKEIVRQCAKMGFEWEKQTVSMAMIKCGGSFVQVLGEALARADLKNTKKIKATWPEYWEEFLKIGDRLYHD